MSLGKFKAEWAKTLLAAPHAKWRRFVVLERDHLTEMLDEVRAIFAGYSNRAIGDLMARSDIIDAFERRIAERGVDAARVVQVTRAELDGYPESADWVSTARDILRGNAECGGEEGKPRDVLLLVERE